MIPTTFLSTCGRSENFEFRRRRNSFSNGSTAKPFVQLLNLSSKKKKKKKKKIKKNQKKKIKNKTFLLKKN